MSEHFSERQEKIIDRYIQASYGLWSSILTVNGIMLAALSIINFSGELNIIILLLTFSCVISLLLIIYNFIVIKATYFRIGEVLNDENFNLTEEERKKDIDVAISRQKRTAIREKICLLLIAVESLLFLLIAVIPYTQ